MDMQWLDETIEPYRPPVEEPSEDNPPQEPAPPDPWYRLASRSFTNETLLMSIATAAVVGLFIGLLIGLNGGGR